MKLKMLAPRATLTLEDDSQITVERIGRGRYTTAWRNCEHVYLQTHEKDMSKELLSRIDDNPHLPKCEELWRDPHTPWNWFRMPLYQPLTAKSGKAWDDFKCLKQAREDAQRAIGYDAKRTDDHDAQLLNAKFVELVDASTCLGEDVKEAVRLLVDECMNYGAYTLEITKKNCAVDALGNLILLDPVFDLAEVRGSRKAAMKRTRGW